MKKLEKNFPWIIAILLAIAICLTGLNLLESKHMESALTAMITATSLIVGFIGAALPVIISLKNESPLVAYIFEHDKANLFYEYTRSAIFSGVFLILAAIVAYFHDLFFQSFLYTKYSFILVFFLVYFMLNALRCLLFLLKAAFGFSNSNIERNNTFKKESQAEVDLKNRLKQGQS